MDQNWIHTYGMQCADKVHQGGAGGSTEESGTVDGFAITMFFLFLPYTAFNFFYTNTNG